MDDAKYKFLFDNDSIVRLNTEQQQHCEGMFTLGECLAALKTFNKSKSPGTDGFTVEFYLRFWGGLKINSTKSEVLWLGKYRKNCSKLYDLKWPQDPIVALGTAFSYDAYKCEV